PAFDVADLETIDRALREVVASRRFKRYRGERGPAIRTLREPGDLHAGRAAEANLRALSAEASLVRPRTAGELRQHDAVAAEAARRHIGRDNAAAGAGHKVRLAYVRAGRNAGRERHTHRRDDAAGGHYGVGHEAAGHAAHAGRVAAAAHLHHVERHAA